VTSPRQRNSSCRPAIRLTGQQIVHGPERWGVALDDLRIIGEFTTPDGPLLDDYFICFVAVDGATLAAPIDADGCRETLAELGQRLGLALEPGLVNSTEYASRILWPAELRGEALFEFRPSAARGWLAGLILGNTQETRLSPGVHRLLEKRP
jgi:hypothetical protein